MQYIVSYVKETISTQTLPSVERSHFHGSFPQPYQNLQPTTGWVWHSPMLLETNDTNKRHLSQILKITPSPSAECPPDIGEIKEDPCIRRLFFQTLSSCSIIQNDHRVTINFCVLWNKLWDWRLIHCSWSRNSTVHLWLAPVLIRKPTLKAGSH